MSLREQIFTTLGSLFIIEGLIWPDPLPPARRMDKMAPMPMPTVMLKGSREKRTSIVSRFCLARRQVRGRLAVGTVLLTSILLGTLGNGRLAPYSTWARVPSTSIVALELRGR
eukprot:CAMPEP_0197716370 /NCGR_PEP_ID=MMETSP1434-20131217/1282_1 /TAXON_ID=265543 /ORGANISM="Minutocellus polymorphus, Strain CCMP3303" /LENGTH=112 /DNA_ID=CAMNT_0043300721 /DNA_START=448 /DNA_END=782 /DNA_ORIENTATION=-